MMMTILKNIAEGKIHTLDELSHDLGISQVLILQMIEDLQKMGFLREELNSDCGEEAPCSGCASKCGCNSMIRQWSLTQKGFSVLQGG